MDIRAIVAGIAFALMWSSAFSSARIIVADASPLFALALRFLISGLIGVAIARALGQSWKLTPLQWRATLVFGICQNSLYLGLNFIAMQTIEAGLASIIASSLPLMVALILWLGYGERLSIIGALGLLAGFVGVTLIMGNRLSAGVDVFGLILCVLGAMALTFATLMVRNATSGGNFLMIVGLQMLAAFATLLPASLLLETVYINSSPIWVAAFAYTTLVPGLLATFVWFWLLNRLGATRAATFHFLNPVFGVAIAAVLLGEQLGMMDVIGVSIVTAGILAVQLSRQK